MRFAAVLNRDGGTLRTIDLPGFCQRMGETLEAAGHSLVVDITSGKAVEAALDKAAGMRGIDVVLAGGGDGTISAAAARLMGTRKALAVLPAGTMNLFARGLGIPQTLDGAIQAFADGEVTAVDMASANGRPFVHQFSVGMHARMVQLREKMQFGSRLGKIGASTRAAWATLNNPPEMEVLLTVGDAEMLTRTPGLGITNNLFGEGHLPYADDPAGGVLGVYVTMARERGELLRFLLGVARGKWRDNQHVDIHQADKVTLRIRSPVKRLRAAIDGELIRLEPKIAIEMHRGALRALVPKPERDQKAAGQPPGAGA
jgi:diacylglycerol kinase family enzyme